MTPTPPLTLAPVAADPVIARLQAARDALATATSLQAVKRIIADVAWGAEIYARRQQLGAEAIGFAHQVKMEALTRLGELLRAMPKAKGGAEPGVGRRGRNAVPAGNGIPTYAELKLDRKTAMVAQPLAARGGEPA